MVVGTRLQLVAGSVIAQLLIPSLTVTVPVRVPAPGAVTATLAVTEIGVLTIDGSGVCEVMTVLVEALFTTWFSGADVLPELLESPE